jgi:hypothetical protein
MTKFRDRTGAREDGANLSTLGTQDLPPAKTRALRDGGRHLVLPLPPNGGKKQPLEMSTSPLLILGWRHTQDSC